MFVIKTKYGAYVEESSKLDCLIFVETDIFDAMKYTSHDLCRIFDKWPEKWEEYGFEVYEVEISIKRSKDWFNTYKHG